MQKNNYYKTINVIVFLLFFIMPSVAKSQEKTVEDWHLTGQEVLLELSDPRGEIKPGIYAWDPTTPPDISHLKLLVEHGQHPVWSPNYQRIAYLFNGDIWIADKEGHREAAIADFMSEHPTSEDQVIKWSPDGKLYFTRRSPIWGTTVFVSIPLESIPVNDLHELYNFPFSLVYALRPLKKSLQDPDFQSIQDITTFDWQNILASNNASFSPDGRFVAAEIYPAGSTDIMRYKSHVQIYESLPETKDTKVTDENMKEFVIPWFHIDAAVPRIKGSGHSLLSDHKKTELMPLWSPDGKKIVLTTMDTEHYSMFPMIVNIDGTLAANIDAPNLDLMSGSKWQSAQAKPTDENQIKQRNSATIFRKAIAWSDDGKYLWMQEKNDGISVAKIENGQWQITQIKGSVSDTAYKPTMACFKGDRILWLDDSGDLRKILNVYIFDAGTGKTQTCSLRSALKVLSVDW